MNLNEQQMLVLSKLIGKLTGADMGRMGMTNMERAMIASLYSLALYELDMDPTVANEKLAALQSSGEETP